MEPQFFDLLPPPIQQLAVEIERLTSRPISIRTRTDVDPIPEGLASFATVHCYMVDGNTHVDITYPGGHLQTHSLIHEILHAWRNVVRAVPYLCANNDDPLTRHTAINLENDLEHVFVIPAEIELAPEAKMYWETFYDNALDKVEGALQFKKRFNRDIAHQQKALMRMWLVTAATPQLECRTRLQSILEQTDSLARATALVADIARVHPDKVLMAATLLSHFGLEREQYCLDQIDTPGRVTHSWEIPAIALR